jgi:hypothetical protein
MPRTSSTKVRSALQPISRTSWKEQGNKREKTNPSAGSDTFVIPKFIPTLLVRSSSSTSPKLTFQRWLAVWFYLFGNRKKYCIILYHYLKTTAASFENECGHKLSLPLDGKLLHPPRTKIKNMTRQQRLCSDSAQMVSQSD